MHHPLAAPIIVDHFLNKNICISSICIWPAILDNTVVITVAGAYLGNKGGGCLVVREACRDFGHAPFYAQESDVYRNYHMITSCDQ